MFREGPLLMAGIIGRKLGMTQVFTEDGERLAVTVIEAGPCPVTAVRESERDGYDAIQLAFGETRERRLSKPLLGHLKKAGAGPLKQLVEFRSRKGEDAPELKIGDTVRVGDIFEPGQHVKVSARSKGKGFQGTIRRHGFHRGPVSHGSHNVRAPGSIGASATPARVIKGVRMPGQMGSRRVTQRRLEIVNVDAERNLLLVKGAVPGPSGVVVEIRSET
jgi:large subunit ribosomal protein L3